VSILYRLVAAAVLPVLLGAPAKAHHIRILPNADGNLVHYSELAENLKEVSPGLLDRIEVTARLLSPKGETLLKTQRGADGISLSGSLGSTECILGEDPRGPVRERKSGEQVTRSIYHPAARFVTDLSAASLCSPSTLCQPISPGGSKSSFEGRRLPRPRSALWRLSAGRAKCEPTSTFEAKFPWKGSYVIQVSHPDPTPGSRGGKSFELTNFVTTLSLVQSTGLEPLASPPAAKPSTGLGLQPHGRIDRDPLE
jgi:hypothetical protein